MASRLYNSCACLLILWINSRSGWWNCNYKDIEAQKVSHSLSLFLFVQVFGELVEVGSLLQKDYQLDLESPLSLA